MLNGKDNYFYGKHLCGEENGFYGREHTTTSKEKMSNTIKQQFQNGRVVWNKGIPSLLRGVPRSEETKRKIGLGNKGNVPWLKGKHLSEETKKRISQLLKGNKNSYIDGRYFNPYPLGWTKTFKEQIRYRDGYKCQHCGMPETENCRRLDVHHSDGNKQNLNLDNLISLCRSCHSIANRKLGNFIKEKLNAIQTRQTK